MMAGKVVVANGSFTLKIEQQTGGVNYVAIDQAIRHMPAVKNAVDAAAYQFLASLPDVIDGLYRIARRGGESRYRAYVHPISNKAYEAEAKHSALLKAALNMEGK